MHTEANDNEEVRRWLHDYVPEVASGLVQIMGIARARGARVIVAVSSRDERVDPVGACIGPRGTHVKTLVRHLSGEKVDVVRWSDSLKTFLAHALAPVRIEDILLQETGRRATIFTSFDQKQALVGTGGLRLELVSQLVGWNLQVQTG